MTSQHEKGPGASAPGPFSGPLRTVTLTLVGLVTIIAFESMAVSTIMPGVVAALHSTAGYGLAFSVMFTAQLFAIVVAGPVIDRYGPLVPTWAGQLVFAAGSLVAGTAPTFSVLLVGRIVAGLGSGLVVVALYVVIGAVYPPNVRPRVFAWVSAAWVLPSIVGPVVAAALAATWSWRAVFLAVLPAVALTSWGLLRHRSTLHASVGADASRGPVLERDGHPPASGRAERHTRRIVALAALVALGAGAFQWAGTMLVPLRPGPAAQALAGLTVLAMTVPRLLPAGAVTLRRGLPAVVLARGLFTATFAGSVTFVPLLLVLHHGLDERAAGAVLALSSLGWSGAAAVQGRPRFAGDGERLVAVGAFALTAGTATLAAAAILDLPPWGLAAGSTLLGVGMGFGTTSISVLTLSLAPPEQRASASSAMTLSDTLGSAVGLAVTGTVFATLTGEQTRAPVAAFSVLWCTATLIGCGALVAALRTRPVQRART